MESEKADPYFECSVNAIKIGWHGTKSKTQTYIVKFREHGEDSMFKQTQAKENEVILSHLKSGTLYEIRVYLERYDGDELLYFSTTASTAAPFSSPFIGMSDKISDKPAIYRFRHANIKNLGNDVRVWEMDSNDGIRHADIEKTILIVGARKGGKSTLINSMINYITGVLYNDGYWFKLVDDGFNSPTISSDMSETKSVTCYKVPKLHGFNVEYALTIIDTPGFEENTESKTNLNIMQQLTTLLESREVKFIDAVCLVLPSSCRLTEGQRNIFGSIMSFVGKDMNCFIPMVTFDDGGQINALNALKKAEVPYMDHMYYRFNNSGLFNNSESEEAWNKRCASWKGFFETLQVVAKQPVDQTLEVLQLKGKLNTELDLLEIKLEVLGQKAENIFENRDLEKGQEDLCRQNENYLYDDNELDYIEEVPCNQLCINCLKCRETCNQNCSCCTRFWWSLILFLGWVWRCICILCCSCYCCICRCCNCCSCYSYNCCNCLEVPKNVWVCKCKCLKSEHKMEKKSFEKRYKKVQKEDTEMKDKYECAMAAKIIFQKRIRDTQQELHSLIKQCEKQIHYLKENYEHLQKIARLPVNDYKLKKLEEYFLQETANSNVFEID